MSSDLDHQLAAWLANRDEPVVRAALADACGADPESARRARALMAIDGLLALRMRGMSPASFRQAIEVRISELAQVDFRRGVLRSLPRRRMEVVRWLVAAALIAITTMLWWAPWTPTQPTPMIADTSMHTAPLTGGGELTLQPGSAWLPATAGGRLQAGVADLVVSKRTAEPFVVDLGDTGITVLGTVFRLRREGAAGSVFLQQGHLAISRRADTWDLKAGEVLDLSASSVGRGQLLIDGWFASPGPQKMSWSPAPPATVTFTAPAGQADTWALAEHAVDGVGKVTLITSGTGDPGTSWGLVASERDGDVWLLAGDDLAKIPVPSTRGWWPGVPPHKQLAANGDGHFDPKDVVKIGIAIGGGAGSITVQEPVAWP